MKRYNIDLSPIFAIFGAALIASGLHWSLMATIGVALLVAGLYPRPILTRK